MHVSQNKWSAETGSYGGTRRLREGCVAAASRFFDVVLKLRGGCMAVPLHFCDRRRIHPKAGETKNCRPHVGLFRADAICFRPDSRSQIVFSFY